MKKIKFLLIIFLLILYSCTQDRSNDDLKAEIAQLKLESELMKKNLDSLNNSYILPFQLYEKNVMNELKSNPDTIIKVYNNLIVKYPNSYWRHEAEKRIENIQKRKKFWSKERGWDLDIPEKPNFNEQTISCPGC